MRYLASPATRSFVRHLVLVALSNGACGTRTPIDRDGIKVGRVVYHVSDDAPYCKNDAQYLSDAVGRLETLLQRKAPNWVHYYRVQGSLSKYCEREVSGCADNEDNTIYANYPALAHELVHMISERRREHLPYFAEGLAEALGEFGSLELGEESSIFSGQPQIEDLLVAEPPRRYETPAATVSALLRQKGVSQTMEFYEHLGTDRTPKRLEAALERIGATTSRLLQWHDEQVATGIAGYPTLRCESDPATFDPATRAWTFHADVGCEAAGHRRDRDWEFTYRRSVELERDIHLVRATTPAGAWLSVTPCERGANLSSYNAHDGLAQVWAVGATSAGLHTASVSVPSDASREPVSLRVEPLAATPYLIETNTTVRLFAADVRQLAFEVALTTPVQLRSMANGVNANVTLCAGELDTRHQDAGTTSPSDSGVVPERCRTLVKGKSVELAPGRYELEFSTRVYNVAEVTFGTVVDYP